MTTGKWARKAVPHKGWICEDITDTGDLSQTCEMCECVTVRYVHTMTHPDYFERLEVGCVCAGHMEEDLLGARQRESAFKSNHARRANWLKRTWRLDDLRNFEAVSVNSRGFHVSVFPVVGGYGARVEHRQSGWRRVAKRIYPTAERAKLAAFDAMIEAEAKRTRL
jgi:hypothetical protein